MEHFHPRALEVVIEIIYHIIIKYLWKKLNYIKFIAKFQYCLEDNGFELLYAEKGSAFSKNGEPVNLR